VLTGGDVDELLMLYSRALSAHSMSLAQAFGFHPWVHTHNLPEAWMATHRRLQHQDPSPVLLGAAPAGASYRVSAESPPEVRERDLFSALDAHGFSDAAITTVANPFGERLFLALYRERGAAPFDADDADLIRLRHPHVARALMARSAVDAIRPDGPRSATDAARRAHGHAFLDGDGVEWSRPGLALIERCFDVPLAAVERCLLDERDRRRGSELPRSFHVGPLRVELAELPRRTLVLLYHESAQPGFGPAAHLLTPAQRRIAAGLARDLSMRGVADELGLSVETVRSHVRAACARLGVKRATAMLALLMSR
jgi:DNA-binding CsgD family transcriptional regulator